MDLTPPRPPQTMTVHRPVPTPTLQADADPPVVAPLPMIMMPPRRAPTPT